MPLSPTHDEVLDSNQMFEEHLAEIALDWVRASPESASTGANSWRPASGFLTLLANSQAELVDLTGVSQDHLAPAIDLTTEVPALQQAA